MKYLTLLLMIAAMLVALPDDGLGNADKVRFHRLCQKLIAPCCWSQTLEFHTSSEADQARSEVAGLIRAGKSDREILDAFVRRYGERILSEPEGLKWVVLTAVPIVTLILASIFVSRFVLRHRRREPVAIVENKMELDPDWDWE
jgi:cytochrome c-type biogenesis protein CcmH